MFDFIIVAVCFLPIGSQYAAVLRLVRVLRVLRLISNVPVVSQDGGVRTIKRVGDTVCIWTFDLGNEA